MRVEMMLEKKLKPLPIKSEQYSNIREFHPRKKKRH